MFDKTSDTLKMFVVFFTLGAALTALAMYTEQAEYLTHHGHFGSKAYQGFDVGQLQNSASVDDSVCVAYDGEPADGNVVTSYCKDRQTGRVYSKTDDNANPYVGEKNYTGKHLEVHWICEEGNGCGARSYH